ncbi:hypothetical protein M3Y98_00951800 [Aphelenchoides besseyi]|nr:hypothetical protein M3Y98_00951800 [Aphelenchoides besseyi]KAI6194577.1 hypothetical protein M3Y96_01139600 [Aphelenchoides besseyi]
MVNSIDECNVYIRFNVQCRQIDEEVVRLLFGQFGGLQHIVMKPENRYAFAQYEKPKYALYVCDLLNGIYFMGAPLVVKPRDNTENFRKFVGSRWSRADRRYVERERTVRYKDLDEVPFASFDIDQFLVMERAKNEQDQSTSFHS